MPSATSFKGSYDSLFHLFIAIKTERGSFIIEKNETASVGPYKLGDDNMSVDLPASSHSGGRILFKDFLENGEKSQGITEFYKYNAITNNCQDWIITLLSANKLLTPDLKAFIKQDIAQVFSSSPITKAIAETLPSIADKLKILFEGAGRQ